MTQYQDNKRDKKKILCIGDSLTFGSVGYSYIGFLSPRQKAVNRGVNGDTTRCAYRRMRAYLNNPVYRKIDTYVIGIGTNDIFLPYLSGVSFLWHLQMKPRCWMKKCILDDRAFKAEYEKYLKLLRKHQKKAVLIGIPMLELKDFPYQTIQNRNRIIRTLARQYGMEYVDIFALQAFVAGGKKPSYSWKHRNVSRIVDAFIMLLFPFTKDRFSKFRKLALTVDGIHYNSVSARLLGEAVSDAI